MRVCGRIADLGILGSGVVSENEVSLFEGSEMGWQLAWAKDASSRMYLARLNMGCLGEE